MFNMKTSPFLPSRDFEYAAQQFAKLASVCGNAVVGLWGKIACGMQQAQPVWRLQRLLVGNSYFLAEFFFANAPLRLCHIGPNRSAASQQLSAPGWVNMRLSQIVVASGYTHRKRK
jgi:hypothetical protein